MQRIKQQIRDLQAQMKEMQAENAAQLQLKAQKKQQRLEKLRLQETQILNKIASLKDNASKIEANIERHQQQLEKVRGIISTLSEGSSV